jgi:hypothetical protein
MICVYNTSEKYTHFLQKSPAKMKITWGQCPGVPKENGGLLMGVPTADFPRVVVQQEIQKTMSGCKSPYNDSLSSLHYSVQGVANVKVFNESA